MEDLYTNPYELSQIEQQGWICDHYLNQSLEIRDHGSSWIQGLRLANPDSPVPKGGFNLFIDLKICDNSLDL